MTVNQSLICPRWSFTDARWCFAVPTLYSCQYAGFSDRDTRFADDVWGGQGFMTYLADEQDIPIDQCTNYRHRPSIKSPLPSLSADFLQSLPTYLPHCTTHSSSSYVLGRYVNLLLPCRSSCSNCKTKKTRHTEMILSSSGLHYWNIFSCLEYCITCSEQAGQFFSTKRKNVKGGSLTALKY